MMAPPLRGLSAAPGPAVPRRAECEKSLAGFTDD